MLNFHLPDGKEETPEASVKGGGGHRCSHPRLQHRPAQLWGCKFGTVNF